MEAARELSVGGDRGCTVLFYYKIIYKKAAEIIIKLEIDIRPDSRHSLTRETTSSSQRATRDARNHGDEPGLVSASAPP